MNRLNLYHTEGCHLCETAYELTLACLAKRGLAADALKRIDIIDDPALLARYGVTIPVLQNEQTGLELNWPFAIADIEKLLQGP